MKKRRKRKSLSPPELQRARRLLFMGVIFTVCILGLLFRIWWWQEIHGEEFAQLSAEQIARRDIESASEIFAPMRGGFLDRHMQPITETQQVYTVFLDVEALHFRYLAARRRTPDADIRLEVFDAITNALGTPRWELVEMFRLDEDGNLAMQSGRRRRVLKHEVPAEIANPLTENFPEIHKNETSVRWYTDGFFAPQVMGFLRGDSVWGLEAFYRKELEGEQGRNFWVLGETETVPVRDGYTLVTTIDGDIQRLAQEHVNRALEKYPSKFVGMIVMEPFTGEILAMVQAPTFSLDEPFNPEYFTCPTLPQIWNDLTEEQRTTEVMSLWRNYHTTRSNEPGSTFKPFVIAAAIEEGVITQHNMFNCVGKREFIDQIVWCHNTNGCGNMSLRRAIYRSCNMAMIDINRFLGRDLFYQYRGYFGFGERTGIDLPGEECVSSPFVMYPYSMLNAVEMATSSIGQGFNATTLQVINGYAALINGGNLMRPYLVSQVVDSNGTRISETVPTVVRRVISEETSDFIRNEMRFTVENRAGVSEFTGTAHRSYIQGHSIGGKTGTAQQGERGGGEIIPTYVAFLPVENPQYLVLMTLDRIEDSNVFAGTTVVPLMREFLVDLIRLRNIQPSGRDDVVPEIFGTPMPDFAGQRLSEAVSAVIRMGAGSYQVVGGGTIISHTWPTSGHSMPETSPIIFYTDSESRIPERIIPVPDVVGLTADMANSLLNEVGLQTVLITGQSGSSNDNNFRPHTSNPQSVGENNPSAPISYTVHRQYPSAGLEVELGTQIIIRAR
jgi:stage V sporulation protein D (sporulation-specific penicillin-binding protein)